MKKLSAEERYREREMYESPDDYIRAKLRRRNIRAANILLTAAVTLTVTVFYLVEHFRVTKVYVDGNTRYSNEEISERVMEGFLGDNSLVMSVKYRFRDMPEFPFIERMDLNVLDHETIQIKVYEKALAGYINHLGSYIYFDRNGTVVETSTQRISDIPEVTGLQFDYIILYEKLPTKSEAIFSRILNTTQLLRKYELHADKIYFDSKENMSIFFGGVRADLGQDEYSDEKLSNLSKILPALEGKKGVLEMESFTPETNNVTFRGK